MIDSLGVLKYYMNGELKGTKSVTLPTSSYDRFALGEGEINDRFCYCFMTDVNVYSRALDDMDVQRQFTR